jgi:hypothetical protein
MERAACQQFEVQKGRGRGRGGGGGATSTRAMRPHSGPQGRVSNDHDDRNVSETCVFDHFSARPRFLRGKEGANENLVLYLL